jgi:site-specific DNA-methyltransferase (adenine-specific)
VTDPPYGDTSLEWDRWVGGWADLLPTDQAWVFGSMRMWLKHGRDEFTSGPSGGGMWSLAQDIVWEKHNGSGSTNDRFRRVHEHALHWYRRRAWGDLYHETPRLAEVRDRVDRRKATPPHWGEFREGTFQSEDGGPRLMRSVIPIRSEHGRAVHPTQKPVGILTPLIEYSCPAGGVVLDPFAGSGSTLVAARMLGRRAIGIEGREDYAEAAVKRLAQRGLFAGGAA